MTAMRDIQPRIRRHFWSRNPSSRAEMIQRKEKTMAFKLNEATRKLLDGETSPPSPR
jgi:hypothetical protein